jgi:hypothetical protein
MRFMLLLKADQNTESGVMPDEKIIVAMGKYNEQLVKAGALLAGDGLQPSSKGARIYVKEGKKTVVDGPFAETKELIAGFWIIQAKSKEEAVEWAMRVPFEVGGPSATAGGNGQIEVRQIFEASDFPPELFESPEGKKTLEAEQAFRSRTNT